MNALSHRRALCILAACAALVGVLPATAGAAAPPRPQSAYALRTAPRRAASPPNLTYHGGRVIGHVKVDVVVWGSWSYGTTVPLTGAHSMSSFFGGITASRYLDWLSEYNTPSQQIGRGTLEGVYTVHPPAADDHATVTSAQIADGLRALIGAGRIPKPSTSRVYAVFFRNGQLISTPFGNSRSNFCAYHDTISYGSTPAYFAIVPYEVGSRGCRAGVDVVRQRDDRRVARARRGDHRSRRRPQPAGVVRPQQRRDRRHLCRRVVARGRYGWRRRPLCRAAGVEQPLAFLHRDPLTRQPFQLLASECARSAHSDADAKCEPRSQHAADRVRDGSRRRRNPLHPSVARRLGSRPRPAVVLTVAAERGELRFGDLEQCRHRLDGKVEATGDVFGVEPHVTQGECECVRDRETEQEWVIGDRHEVEGTTTVAGPSSVTRYRILSDRNRAASPVPTMVRWRVETSSDAGRSARSWRR